MRPERRPEKAFVAHGQAFHRLLQDRFTACRRPSEVQGRRERAASSSGSGGRMAAGEAGSTAPGPLPGLRLTLPTPGASGGRGIPRQGQKPPPASWLCCRHAVCLGANYSSSLGLSFPIPSTEGWIRAVVLDPH